MIHRILVLLLVLPCLLTNTLWAANYKVGKGDVLEVSVWGVPEMSRSVTVRPDGKITLPAVGDIVADRLEPEELSHVIAAQMKRYVKEPIVTVSVQQIINNRIYITGGELSRAVDMTKETSLLRLLSELGDLSTVDLRKAYLLRGEDKIKSDFYSLYYSGNVNEDVSLQSEDIVFLPSNRNNLVYVLGAVVNPQNLHYYEGMRVLDAVLAAGGFTEFAKEDVVYVMDENKKKSKLDLKSLIKGKDLDANVLLHPGDYVIVEESLF